MPSGIHLPQGRQGQQRVRQHVLRAVVAGSVRASAWPASESQNCAPGESLAHHQAGTQRVKLPQQRLSCSVGARCAPDSCRVVRAGSWCGARPQRTPRARPPPMRQRPQPPSHLRRTPERRRASRLRPRPSTAMTPTSVLRSRPSRPLRPRAQATSRCVLRYSPKVPALYPTSCRPRKMTRY